MQVMQWHLRVIENSCSRYYTRNENECVKEESQRGVLFPPSHLLEELHAHRCHHARPDARGPEVAPLSESGLVSGWVGDREREWMGEWVGGWVGGTKESEGGDGVGLVAM